MRFLGRNHIEHSGRQNLVTASSKSTVSFPSSHSLGFGEPQDSGEGFPASFLQFLPRKALFQPRLFSSLNSGFAYVTTATAFSPTPFRYLMSITSFTYSKLRSNLPVPQTSNLLLPWLTLHQQIRQTLFSSTHVQSINNTVNSTFKTSLNLTKLHYLHCFHHGPNNHHLSPGLLQQSFKNRKEFI